MAKKTVRFNKGGLEKLPEDKPVVYKIVTGVPPDIRCWMHKENDPIMMP